MMMRPPQKTWENLILNSGIVTVRAEKGSEKAQKDVIYPVPGFPSLVRSRPAKSVTVRSRGFESLSRRHVVPTACLLAHD